MEGKGESLTVTRSVEGKEVQRTLITDASVVSELERIMSSLSLHVQELKVRWLWW